MPSSLFERLGSTRPVLPLDTARPRAAACLLVLSLLAACDAASSAPRGDAAQLTDDAAPASDDAAQAMHDADAPEPALDGGASLSAMDSSSPAELDADAAPLADATPATDATGPTDAATLTPQPCDTACTDAEACLDGHCQKHCGADVQALRAALAPMLYVHFTMCDDGAFAQAVPRDTLTELYVLDGGTLSYGYRSDTTGPFSSELAVTPALPAGTTLIPSPFLAVAPHGGPLLFGYTASAPGAPGGLFLATWPLGEPVRVSELSAPGNRAAAIATSTGAEKPDLFFVLADALGAAQEGPGVYRGSVDGGIAPGLALRGVGAPQSIATSGGGGLVHSLLVSALPAPGTSWPDGGGSRLFVIPVDELRGAPVDVLTHAKVARFSDLPLELETGRGMDEVAFITRDPATHTIATLDVRTFWPQWNNMLSAPTRWVTGGAFTSFRRTGYSGVMLRHAHGTWFARAR